MKSIDDKQYLDLLQRKLKALHCEYSGMYERGGTPERYIARLERELLIINLTWFGTDSAGELLDPFLVLMFGRFNEYAELKMKNPIELLLSERKDIADIATSIFNTTTCNLKHSNEELVDKIAIYQSIRGFIGILRKDESFTEFQKANKMECNEIFFTPKIELFFLVEEALFADGYLSHSGKWLGKKDELAIILDLFYEQRYFKRSKHGVETSFTKYRNFFQRRYKVDISKQCQSGYRMQLRNTRSYKEFAEYFT